VDQRIAWHRRHQKACGCRPIPASLQAKMKAKMKVKTGGQSEADPNGGAAVDPRLAKVVAAFARERGVTYGGKGFGSSALKVNGSIFAMMDAHGTFVVKLPKERVAALVTAGKGNCFDAGKGRPMKEWLAVRTPPKSWLDLAREAWRFVRDRK
jgi:hypothetical protein